ncbi:MAG: hypothetical protein EZS28_038603, partial [Streblomastix strix]
MSFASSDYLKRLASAQHSDYINSYSQFQEIFQTQTIISQSFSISKQQFFDQPVTQLTNDGAHYTRAPLAARGTATCSLWVTDQTVTMESGGTAATMQPYNTDEHIKFWLEIVRYFDVRQRVSNNCLKLIDGLMYRQFRNSFSTRNVAASFSYPIPYDIVFSGVMDLNQLNSIFNNFPVLTRNYTSLYIQLWMQDFIQDLKVVWLNKYNPIDNMYLAYAMIPPEKPDIICLKNRAAEVAYDRYNIRLVNMEGKPNTTAVPTATISQIKNAKFTELYINNICFNMENEGVIIEMIRKQRIINFPTKVLRTQSSNHPTGNIADGRGF